MSPLLFQNRALTVGSYPFFYGLGLVCAAIIAGLLLRERGYAFRDSVRTWTIVCLAIIFGGRLFYFLIYGHSQHLRLSSLFSLNQGGEVLYGALICGTLSAWYACRHFGLAGGKVLDAGAVATPVGIAIGRVGCLLKGCCHGARCDGWYGIRYPKVVDIYGNVIGSAAYFEDVRSHAIEPTETWSLPVHPVPVYESIVCLCMAAVMFVLWKRRALPGRLFFTFGSLYAVWRFAVEFIRIHEPVVGPFTIYQAISVGVLIACIIMCLLVRPTVPSRPMKSSS